MYRSHFDQTTTNSVNVKFLLGDFDEKHWGQQLGKNERKRKRDAEVQEIFAAFRMVAVELLNRVQNYLSDTIRTFTELPVKKAEQFLEELNIEITALIQMINDALRNASIVHSYSVPYIAIDGQYYSIKTKNFSDEVKKKRPTKKDADSDTVPDDDTASVISEKPILVADQAIKRKKTQVAEIAPTVPTDETDDDLNSITEYDTVAASLKT